MPDGTGADGGDGAGCAALDGPGVGVAASEVGAGSSSGMGLSVVSAATNVIWKDVRVKGTYPSFGKNIDGC